MRRLKRLLFDFRRKRFLLISLFIVDLQDSFLTILVLPIFNNFTLLFVFMAKDKKATDDAVVDSNAKIVKHNDKK